MMFELLIIMFMKIKSTELIEENKLSVVLKKNKKIYIFGDHNGFIFLILDKRFGN